MDYNEIEKGVKEASKKFKGMGEGLDMVHAGACSFDGFYAFIKDMAGYLDSQGKEHDPEMRQILADEGRVSELQGQIHDAAFQLREIMEGWGKHRAA